MTPRNSRVGANEPQGRPSILVIDDSDVDRAAMTELLERAGYEVHELPSPIGATRTARQVAARLVVIDQNLPAMDGGKLATLFRGNAAMRHMRLVLVSGNETQEMLDIAREAKADAFVAKSSLHTDLVKTVARLLQ